MVWAYSAQPEQARYPVREMLVNYADGFVRRGLSGETALLLSDTFGGPPTAWATAMLVILGAALFAACIHLFRLMPNDPALLPFVLAPWGLMFLVYDPDVMIRKEAFGFVLLSILLIGALSRNTKTAIICLLFTCFLMPVAILLHEVNAALGGPLLIGAWLMTKRHPALTRSVIFCAIAASVASILATLSILTNSTANPALICAAIQDLWCHDPFAYFDDSMDNGRAFVQAQIPPSDRAITAVLLSLAALPFIGVRVTAAHPVTIVALALAVALPVLPLFVVAADYGRWIMILVFPSSLLIATALSLGVITYRRFLPHWATLLFCGSWSLYHYRVEPQAMGLLIWAFLLVAIALKFSLSRPIKSRPKQVPTP